MLSKIDNQDLLIIKTEFLAKKGEIDEATSLLRKIDTTTRAA